MIASKNAAVPVRRPFRIRDAEDWKREWSELRMPVAWVFIYVHLVNAPRLISIVRKQKTAQNRAEMDGRRRKQAA
jgi:hypothetical protein